MINILNYNYAGKNLPRKKNLNVSVPIPAGFAAEGENVNTALTRRQRRYGLQYTVEGNQLKFNVPELYIWSVIIPVFISLNLVRIDSGHNATAPFKHQFFCSCMQYNIQSAAKLPDVLPELANRTHRKHRTFWHPA